MYLQQFHSPKTTSTFESPLKLTWKTVGMHCSRNDHLRNNNEKQHQNAVFGALK